MGEHQFPTAACACNKVERETIDNVNGTVSDRWRCATPDGCGQVFVKQSMGPVAQLQRFHEVFDHHMPSEPTLDDFPYELRMKLILEEAQEFVEACGYHVELRTSEMGAELDVRPREEAEEYAEADWVQMIDACCDLLYVVYGALVSMGFTPFQVRAFFDEVHFSNMAKADGGKNEYGKSKKPPGWKPPDLDKLLRRFKVHRLEHLEVTEVSLVDHCIYWVT